MTFRGDHVDELISASLTGDLTDAERAELDAHLARCEKCRATLAAFKAERRVLSGLPAADPPRDLSARVRAGIASRQFGQPWWRRPAGLAAIGASFATVAAAVVAVVLFNNVDVGPVGQHSPSPHPSESAAPSATPAVSATPTALPTPVAAFALGPGELGYLSLNGASLEAERLSFNDDANGDSLDLGTVSGPPIAAALSPMGDWLAYITQKGETGANEVWALHLTDGEVVPLGCSAASPFTDRLSWWVQVDKGNNVVFQDLGYTLTSIDLGSASRCPANEGKPGTTDPWLFDANRINPIAHIDLDGDTYLGSFRPPFDGLFLTVSKAGLTPSSGTVCWGCDSDPSATPMTDDAVFAPLYSPDGNRALFWSGTMAKSGDSWEFSHGGMPQLSGDFRSAGPASPWIGTPLFTDLTASGGEAFAFGKFTWGPDSDLIAFWDGAWTGAPQSADGSYPSQTDVYVGRISTGLLSKASKLGFIRPKDSYVVDVTFSPDGKSVAVTLGLPSAGIGDPPSAWLEIVPLDGTTPRSVGGGVDSQPWNGPAVFGR